MDRHVGQADDALVVFAVAPALVPLQQQRHGLRPGKAAEVDRRGQIFFLRVVAHEIARVGIAGIELHERVRIIIERGIIFLGIAVQLALRALGRRLAAREQTARKHAEDDQRQQHHNDQQPPAAAFSCLSGHGRVPFRMDAPDYTRFWAENLEKFLKSFLNAKRPVALSVRPGGSG